MINMAELALALLSVMCVVLLFVKERPVEQVLAKIFR